MTLRLWNLSATARLEQWKDSQGVRLSTYTWVYSSSSPNLISKILDQMHYFSTLAHTQAGIKKEKYSKKAPVNLSNRSHHIISLYYPLVLQNMLPFPIEVTENSSSTEKRSLNPGELTHYSHTTIINNPRFLTTVSLISAFIYSFVPLWTTKA